MNDEALMARFSAALTDWPFQEKIADLVEADGESDVADGSIELVPVGVTPIRLITAAEEALHCLNRYFDNDCNNIGDADYARDLLRRALAQ